MKRERTNKEKGRKKKKTKVALRFLVGMRREGERSFGGSFSSFATLSLSLSLSIWKGNLFHLTDVHKRVHVVTLMLRPEWRLRSL